MTPRELSGWVPSETQTHYNAEGVVVGFTVVERESRIDDIDRTEMLALAEYEAGLCRCGYHPILADDESNTFKASVRKCPVCAGEAVHGRLLAVDDEAVSNDAPPMQPRPSDGRHPYMQLLTPEQAKAALKKT